MTQFPYVTTAYIAANLALIEEKLPSQQRLLDQAAEQQSATEQQLIEQTDRCNSVKASNSAEASQILDNLNKDKLEQYVYQEFYNPNIMENLSCIVDMLIYVDGINYRDSHKLIKKYIANLTQLSAGANGVAMRSSFDDIKDLFIVKSPLNPASGGDEILHELIVGLYGTNKLRKYIPNFSYIYGGFKCSPPKLENKKVVSWCTSNNNAVNYVLYENIAPAQPANKFMRTCTVEQFLNIYLQLIYSLKMALDMIDFTHYDLHNDNVLIRFPFHEDEKFQIHYTLSDVASGKTKDIYLQSNFIATIIDYGFAHIQYDKKNFGIFGFERFFILQERSHIMHDLYKFLMFSLENTRQNENMPVYEAAKKIFTFFNNSEDPADILVTQRKNYYCYPITNETNYVTANALEAFILNNFPNECAAFLSATQDDTIPILDCQNMCLTKKEILAELSPIRLSKTSLKTSVKSPKKVDILDELKIEFRKLDNIIIKEGVTNKNIGDIMIKIEQFLDNLAMAKETKTSVSSMKYINDTQNSYQQYIKEPVLEFLENNDKLSDSEQRRFKSILNMES